MPERVALFSLQRRGEVKRVSRRGRKSDSGAGCEKMEFTRRKGVTSLQFLDGKDKPARAAYGGSSHTPQGVRAEQILKRRGRVLKTTCRRIGDGKSTPHW